MKFGSSVPFKVIICFIFVGPAALGWSRFLNEQNANNGILGLVCSAIVVGAIWSIVAEFRRRKN